MSNSKLVCYTKISPNKTSPRRNTIKKITIHHMAGNLSIETCGNVFAPSSRQASSNYGIGTDGRIGMYVEEKDRAWTSSSPDNDNQAVTIEVANDQIGGNWHVSDKAMESLINLCVDICQRNGIKSLNFTGNKNGNLTMHKYFASTACPGPYLESKFPYIAQEVNKRLSGSSSSSGSTATVKPETVSDVESTIWNYFKGKGFSDCGIAGLMGNLYAESGLKSTNLQNTYEKKLGYTDDTYTTAVDNGSYTNFVKDSAGYGLAQWTYWSRKQGLLEMAQSQKKSVGSLSLQLDYLYKELSESFKTVLNTLKTATTVAQASNAVLLDFERPANQSQSVQTQRANYGQKYLDKFGKSTSTNTSGSTTLAVGDEVYFSGNTHYTSASATSGKKCTSGVAKITRTYNGKHPYHIVGSNGCTAYGWVDSQYLTKETGTCTANLNLREGTTTSTKSLGIMKNKSKVFILGTASNGWYKVYSVSLKKVGYCSNSYITK